MVDILSNLLNAITNVPTDAWALVFGAIGLSALQRKVTNYLELRNDKLLVFITTVVSFAAAVIPAALGWLSANPSVLGQHTALFFTAMTLGYRFIVKPGSEKLTTIKAAVAQAEALKATQPAPPQLAIYGSGSPELVVPTSSTVVSPEYDG